MPRTQQFTMGARRTSDGAWIVWTVATTPDTAGTYAGVPIHAPAVVVRSGWADDGIVYASSIQGAPWTTPFEGVSIQTTDATPTTIRTISPDADKGHAFEFIITACRPDRTELVRFVYRAEVRNAAGVLTIQDETTEESDGGASGYVVGFTISGSDLLLRVTGALATTLDWLAVGTVLTYGS